MGLNTWDLLLAGSIICSILVTNNVWKVTCGTAGVIVCLALPVRPACPTARFSGDALYSLCSAFARQMDSRCRHEPHRGAAKSPAPAHPAFSLLFLAQISHEFDDAMSQHDGADDELTLAQLDLK